ncbi:MAG: Rrf2 family transcriptional regulator [Rhizobiaceae bacterium]|nr:Rrf2 family transcriptional regulator [Rhizobiaceae bacterium]
MRLNQASDFALRILMRLADNGSPMTVEALTNDLHLVKSHVMKIVAKLARAGIVNSTRGRSGGISLARPMDEISIGEVVRLIEADFAVVECLREGQSNCVFSSHCKLRGVMNNATRAFMQVLDQQSLQSISVSLPLE